MARGSFPSLSVDLDKKEEEKKKKVSGPSEGSTRNHPTRKGIKQKFTNGKWTNIRGGETSSTSKKFKKRTRYKPGAKKTQPEPTKVGTEQTVINRRGRKSKTGKVWDGTKWVKGPLKRGQNLPASAGDKNAKGGEGDKKTWPTGKSKTKQSQSGDVRGTWVNGKFVVQGKGPIRNNVQESKNKNIIIKTKEKKYVTC